MQRPNGLLFTALAIYLITLAWASSSAAALVPPNCSVDAAIAPLGKPFIGTGVVDPVGSSQTAHIRARRSQLRLFLVDVTNTGTDADSFGLSASVLAPSTTVMISDGSANVTGDAESGIYSSASVAPGQTHRFVIWMRPYTSGPYGDVRWVKLSTTCRGSLASSDTVIAEITVRR